MHRQKASFSRCTVPHTAAGPKVEKFEAKWKRLWAPGEPEIIQIKCSGAPAVRLMTSQI